MGLCLHVPSFRHHCPAPSPHSGVRFPFTLTRRLLVPASLLEPASSSRKAVRSPPAAPERRFWSSPARGTPAWCAGPCAWRLSLRRFPHPHVHRVLSRHASSPPGPRAEPAGAELLAACGVGRHAGPGWPAAREEPAETQLALSGQSPRPTLRRRPAVRAGRHPLRKLYQGAPCRRRASWRRGPGTNVPQSCSDCMAEAPGRELTGHPRARLFG